PRARRQDRARPRRHRRLLQRQRSHHLPGPAADAASRHLTHEASMVARTILLADDDTAIRTVLSQALGRAGYDVRATSNAATLWRWVADGEGDVVVTDV